MVSSATFLTAAKHLFRHLHEPHALRKNPLVRRFFEEGAVGGISSGRYQRQVLEHIHELVRLGADRCRDADLASGKEERARRRHAIVVLQCLERLPIKTVAAKLRISTQHCYRERAAVCTNIARFVAGYDSTATLDYLPELDEFRLLLDCAMRQFAHGDMTAALHILDHLIGSAPVPSKKVEALRLQAAVFVEIGNLERAKEAYDSAKALASTESSSESSLSRAVASACVDLVGCELAYYRADTALALRLARRATDYLAPHQAKAPTGVLELYVESLCELGAALWNLGDLERGHDCFSRAQVNLPHIRPVAHYVHTKVTMGLWKLRSHLLMSSQSWYPLRQRLEGLSLAFERAHATGSLHDSVDALVSLAQGCAYAERDDQSLRFARLASVLVRQHPSERIRSQISIQLASFLLLTRHWQYGLSLLDTANLEACDGYHRAVVAYLGAERALRGGEFDVAWTLAKETNAHSAYPAIVVKNRLIAASAANQLGWRREARELISESMPAAEALGSVPILRDACVLRATITGDSRFGRQARDLQNLLTA